MSKIALIVEFEVKPEYFDQFIEVMKGHAAASEQEEGCLQFKMMASTALMDYRVFLFEEWKDQAALDWHLKHSQLGATRKQYESWIFMRHITHTRVVTGDA